MIFRGSWVLVLLAAVRSGLSASGASSSSSIPAGLEVERPAASQLRGGDGPTYTDAEAGTASDGPDSDSESGSELHWDSSGSSGSESSSGKSQTGGGAPARAGGNGRGRRRTLKTRTRTGRKRSSSSSSSSSRNKSRTQERGSASRSRAAGSSGRPSSDRVLREPAREQITSGRRPGPGTSPGHDEEQQDKSPDEQQGSCSICMEDAANLGPENALMQPPTQMRCQCSAGGMCQECLYHILTDSAYTNMLKRHDTARTVRRARSGDILYHRLSYDDALRCTVCKTKYAAPALHAVLRQWILRGAAKNSEMKDRQWILAPEYVPGELNEDAFQQLVAPVAPDRLAQVTYMDAFHSEENRYWQYADVRDRLNERWNSWYRNLALVAAGYPGGGEKIYFFETAHRLPTPGGREVSAATAQFESWRGPDTPDLQAPAADARQQFMAHLLLQRDSKSGKTLLLDAMDAHLDTRSGRIYHVLSAESASRLDFVWQLAVTFLTPGQMRKLLLTRARDGRTVLHAAAQLATHEVAWDSQVLSARDDRAQRATGGEEVLERSLQLRLIANWLSVKEQRTLLFKTHTQVSSGVMVDVARGREEDPRYSAWINSARYSEKDRAEAEGVANMVLAPYRNSGEEAGSVILRVLDESCAAVAPARSAAASTTTAAVARSGSSSALPQRTGVALEKCLARNEESLLYARTEGGASRLGVIRLAAPSTVEWILQKVRADDRKVVRAREMKRFEPHLKDGPVFRLGEPSREHLRNCLEAHRLCRQFAFLLHAAGNPDEPVYLTNRRSDGNPDEPFYRVSGLKPSTRLRVLLNLMAYNKGPTDATALADPASLQHTYDAFRGYEQGPDLPFRLLDSGSGSERAALLWVWHNLVRHTTLFREIRHTIWEAYAVATIPKKYLNAHQITTREEEMEMLKRDISTKVRLGEQSADPHPAHLEKCLELYLSCHKFAFLLHHTDGAAGEIPLHSAAAGGDLPAVATMLGVRLRGSSEGRDATSHQLGLEGEQNAGAVRALDWVREKLLLAETKSTDSPTLGSPGKTVHDLLLDQWRATISTYNQNADPVEHLARLLHATLMQPRGSGDSLLQLERIILYTKAHNGGSGLHTASGARLDWFLERIWLDRQNVVATTEMEHFDKGSYLRESGAPEREGVDACLKTDGRCRQFAFLLHAVDASGSTALHMAGEKRDFSKAEQLIGRKQLNFIWSATSRTVNALKPFGDPGKDHSNNDRALGWIWKLLLNKPNNEGRAAKDVFASASEAWYKEKGQTAVSESIGKLRKMFKELQPFS